MQTPEPKSIPNFRKYLVYPDGGIFSKVSDKFLKTFRDPKSGYHYVGLSKDDNTKSRVSRHKLVATAFVEKPDNAEVVNHLNCIKGDDRYTNLEWCTQYQNLKHASINGINPKFLAVELRNVLTGEVAEYESFISCAKALGLSKDAVSYRVNIGETHAFDGKQYRLRQPSGTPWKEPLNNDVVVRDVVTNKVSIYSNLAEAARGMGCPLVTLCKWAKRPGQPVFYGKYQLKRADDRTPWREIDDLVLEVARSANTRVVEARSVKTGEVFRYGSVTECAKNMQLPRPYLESKLKRGSKSIDPRGFVYSFVSPLGSK